MLAVNARTAAKATTTVATAVTSASAHPKIPTAALAHLHLTPYVQHCPSRDTSSPALSMSNGHPNRAVPTGIVARQQHSIPEGLSSVTAAEAIGSHKQGRRVGAYRFVKRTTIHLSDEDFDATGHIRDAHEAAGRTVSYLDNSWILWLPVSET